MCGRATLTSPAEDIASLFEVEPIATGPARFNVAPTQPMLTVRARRVGEDEGEGERAGGRELAFARWGLVPWWAKPDEAKAIGARCIQARAETAARSPAFRDAFRRHRCLVVVDGFFEWKSLPDGRRVPHHVRKSSGGPFAIAGLWDRWSGGPEPIESCAVVTIPSGGPLETLHDRMPLVLFPDEWTRWIAGAAEDASALLAPSADRARDLVAIPVSTWVNDVRHDDARCIEPAPIVDAPIEPGAGQIDFGFAASGEARARRRRR